MRILFVTPPPYLPNRLHRNRSFDLIRIMAEKHEVHLLCLTTKKEILEEFNEIKKMCKSVKIIYKNPLKSMLNCLRFPFLPAEVAYCYSEKATKEIQNAVNKYDIDLLYLKRLRNAIHLMGYGDFIGIASSSARWRITRNDSIPVILDTTDAMSMFYFRMHKINSFPKNLFYLWQGVLYKRFERKIMKRIKNWIVCSTVDQKYLQEFGHDVSIHVVPNPVDVNYFSPSRSSSSTSKESRSLPRHLRGVASFSPSRSGATPPRRSPFGHLRGEKIRGGYDNSLLFRGLMDKPVNIDAALFFIRSIFPIVKKKVKDIKLYIVGPKPPSVIKKYDNGKDIFVTGFVQDIRKYIKETNLAICPVRIASGTRFKILQSWSMGRPVVSTTIGAEGLLYEKDKNIAIADNPKEFAKQIINLLKNKKLYVTLAKKGRETIVREYSFKVIRQKLEEVIQNVKDIK